MSGHFYELPSVFPAAGTTFPIQSMYSLLPSSMEVVMTSHTSYGWFSASWDAIYTCSIHYQMLLLSYFSQTLSAPPPGLFLFWSSSEPRNHFLSSPPTRTHSWSLTRENWYFQIYHSVLLLTWNDVDASRELVGHQPARNLLGHVAAGRRHEGHGEVLGLPVGRGHPGHRVQPGPRHTRHQVPRLAQDLWHQHQQGHGYLHTF